MPIGGPFRRRLTTSTLGVDYFWTPIMAYFSVPIDTRRVLRRENASEGALHDAAVDPQRCARDRRRQRACEVGHERGDLVWRLEPLDERGRTNLLKELGLELLEALAAAMAQRK